MYINQNFRNNYSISLSIIVKYFQGINDKTIFRYSYEAIKNITKHLVISSYISRIYKIVNNITLFFCKIPWYFFM